MLPEVAKDHSKKASVRGEWAAFVLSKRTWSRQLERFLRFEHKEGKQALLLVLLGVLAALVNDIIGMSVLGLNWTRRELVKAIAPFENIYAEFAVWSVFTVAVATASVVWTAFFDPMAAGSGIPEMKSIISYESRRDASRCLRARTLVSKIGGLSLALGSGVSVGKEGPFVHTSSIIAHRLMKHLSWCRQVYDSDLMRRQIYDAACAIGVACTFRSPIGGALFAIEVTSTVFMVSNYWRAFIAAMSALLTRQAVIMVHDSSIATYHPMFPTNFANESFQFIEVAAFAALAVFMGFLGALYASASTGFKQRWKLWAADKHVVLASWVLLLPLAVVLCIPEGLFRLTIGEVVQDLFSSGSSLHDRWHTNSSLSLLAALPLAGSFRLGATALSTSLPIPAGDFLPTFVAGAMFGRFFGEVLQVMFPTSGVVAGGYALTGGAGFVASTTNTASVAVIALEFTGQLVYTIPLILSTLIASGVGCALRVSVYDSVIAKKGLFCHLPMLRLEEIKVRDVMLKKFPLLTLDMGQTQLQQVLDAASVQALSVVDNLDNRTFIGCVDHSSVGKILSMAPSETRLQSVLQLPMPVLNVTPTRSTKENEMRGSSALTLEQAQGAVDFIHNRLYVDSTALQVDPDASLQRAHLLFEMIKCSSIWVTRRGQLVGLLCRHHLHHRVQRKNNIATDVSPSLLAPSDHS